MRTYVCRCVSAYVCMYVRCEPGVVSVSFLLLHCYSAQEGLVLATTSTRSNRRSSAPTQSWHLRRATRNSQASRVSRYTTLSHHGHWRPSHGTHRPRWVRSSDSLWRVEGRGGYVGVYVRTCVCLLTAYIRTHICMYTHVRTYMHTYTYVCTYICAYVHMCLRTYVRISHAPYTHYSTSPTPPHLFAPPP